MRLRSDLVRTNNCDIIKPGGRGGDESDAGAKAGSRDFRGEGGGQGGHSERTSGKRSGGGGRGQLAAA